MRKSRFNYVDDLDVPCRRCKAGVGEDCFLLNGGGLKTKYIHTVRGHDAIAIRYQEIEGGWSERNTYLYSVRSFTSAGAEAQE